MMPSKDWLDQNTLLFFTSDNGVGPVAHKMMKHKGHVLRKIPGMKAFRYEGGHRVPFIAKWPGKLAAGTTSESTINFTDFFATFADLLKVNLEERLPSAVDSTVFFCLKRTGKRFPDHRWCTD